MFAILSNAIIIYKKKYDCGGLTDKEWETVVNGCLKIQIEWTV